MPRGDNEAILQWKYFRTGYKPVLLGYAGNLNADLRLRDCGVMKLPMASLFGSSDGNGAFHFSAPKIRFPLLQELPDYSLRKLKADLLAGSTLALVSIPQAIGFALILGLPPAPVIMSMVIGGFVGALFFSSHHHVFGPTSSVSLVVASTIASLAGAGFGLEPLQLAVFLALLIGALQFIAGLLHFGEVTKFISRSVVVAYSAAIGLMLVASQLHHLAGVHGADGGGFFTSLLEMFFSVFAGNFSWGDVAIGVVTFMVLIVVHKLRPKWPEALVALLFAGLLARGWAWLLEAYAPGAPLPFHLVEAGGQGLADGLSVFSWLPLSHGHLESLPALFSSALAISIIGMLESAAITKTLAAKSGQRVDPNQEMMGMGAGNMACAVFGAVPGSSSFTRSGVNYQCGALSQLSSVFSSAIVLLVFLAAMPVFNYIPLAALAAQLIRLGIRMITPSQIRVACRSTHSDAAVFACTLGTALLIRLDIAIYVGIALALALFLRKTSSPMLVEYSFDDSGSLAQLSDKSQRVNPQIAIIHVEGELFFGAADGFLTQVRTQADDENIRLFILRLKNARHLDASTVMALDSLHESLQKSGRHLLISGCSPDVLKVLRDSGISKSLGEENIFAGDPVNPNVSTRKALIRASQVLSSADADIRIFYDKRKTEGAAGQGYTLNFQI
ncbi:MAG: SulP family inorganic anion transporter [Puniceicoccales bacterium]|jgi:SulP family sulfate permease|nr:SulP family inorganic anion transporter [Puniceicoccales bacterium]